MSGTAPDPQRDILSAAHTTGQQSYPAGYYFRVHLNNGATLKIENLLWTSAGIAQGDLCEGGGYRNRLPRCVVRVSEIAAIAVLSLHYNAPGDPPRSTP